MQFDDLMMKKSYSSMGAYKQSKLANILFTKELNRRLEGKLLTMRMKINRLLCFIVFFLGSGVTVYTLHPGNET